MYPSEVLAPLGGSGCAKNFTKNTIAVHHAELSWISVDEKMEYTRFVEKILHRIEKQTRGGIL
jgi:hypothetical protein